MQQEFPDYENIDPKELENKTTSARHPDATGCVGVCKLDATGRYCIGCLRTPEQIAEDGKES